MRPENHDSTPGVKLELGSKVCAIEIDLCLEGERVCSNPLRLHLEVQTKTHKQKRQTRGDMNKVQRRYHARPMSPDNGGSRRGTPHYLTRIFLHERPTTTSKVSYGFTGGRRKHPSHHCSTAALLHESASHLTWCRCSIEPRLMRMALMPSVVSESTDWPIKNRRFTCR